MEAPWSDPHGQLLWDMAWVNPCSSPKGKAGLWDPFELFQASEVIFEPDKFGGVGSWLPGGSGLAAAGGKDALEGF